MSRDSAIAIRVARPLKEAIETLADEDDRSVSQYLERVLTNHLREKGRLPSTAAPVRLKISGGASPRG